MTETPKEFIDRTMRKRVTAIIDETNTNNDDHERKNIFAVGAVITDKPDEFSKLSADLRKIRGSPEVKYKNNRGSRKGMEEMISALDAEVIGVYVEKEKMNPPWFSLTSRRHTSLLEELTKDLIKLNVDFDKIVIDDDDKLQAYNEDGSIRYLGKETVEDLLAGVRNVGSITQEVSVEGLNADLIQTADFAIGAMGRVLREENSSSKVRFRTRRHK